MLTRDAILGAGDLKRQEVEVPEWGGKVTVRAMTVAERNEFVRRSTAGEPTTVWLVVTLCVDAEGKPLFKAEDEAALDGKYFRAVDAVARAALEANALTVEAAAKN